MKAESRAIKQGAEDTPKAHMEPSCLSPCQRQPHCPRAQHPWLLPALLWCPAEVWGRLQSCSSPVKPTLSAVPDPAAQFIHSPLLAAELTGYLVSPCGVFTLTPVTEDGNEPFRDWKL